MFLSLELLSINKGAVYFDDCSDGVLHGPWRQHLSRDADSHADMKQHHGRQPSCVSDAWHFKHSLVYVSACISNLL